MDLQVALADIMLIFASVMITMTVVFCTWTVAFAVVQEEPIGFFHKKISLQYYLRHPDKITVEYIQACSNGNDAIKLYSLMGHERYISKLLTEKDVWLRSYKDDVGRIYIYDINDHHPTLHVVQVKNSSPEPDGTYKDYYIRVPRRIYSARQAIAWTFGLEDYQYSPDIET